MDKKMYMLSNYGLRLLNYLQENEQEANPNTDELSEIYQRVWCTKDDISSFDVLYESKLVEEVPKGYEKEDVELRYKRNPLENLHRVTFEYTTLCNLSCSHCRNGNLRPITQKKLPDLFAVVDAVLPLGISRFDFIGGEVLLYGLKWPKLVSYIRSYDEKYSEISVNILTSGWFLEQSNFWAAGERYQDDEAFLHDLKTKGVTHLTFSLDGPEELHDICRKTPGLYRRIMNGLDKIRHVGLIPQFSILELPHLPEEQNNKWKVELANALYPHLPEETRIYVMIQDWMNYMSHFIDVGNGGHLFEQKDGRVFSPQYIRCKNFFRPYPTLRIKADGEISMCPLIEAGDGYGNVHKQNPITLLNRFQDNFVYRLHAENIIVDYISLLDKEIFPDAFQHICSYRVVLTMLAQEIDKAGYNAATVPTELCRELNIKVARRAGFMPSDLPSPLGRSIPK